LAKRRTKQGQERKRLLSEGYFECSSCGTILRPKTRRCGECGALTRTLKRTIYAALTVTIVVIASVTVYIYCPRESYNMLPSVVEFVPSGYGA